jgi:hypothetical protein
LSRLANAVHHNHRVANGIEFLHVSLTKISANSIRTLNRLLSHTSAVTDLTVLLPCSPHNVFRNIRLRNLSLFKTNITHQALENFIRRHPHIQYIDLGPCSARRTSKACPLKDINIPSLYDLTCPPACITAFRGANVTRIRATYQSIHDERLPLFQVFCGTHFESTSLTVLHLDFDPSEFGTLRCIAHTAPLLTVLKLIEQHHSTTVSAILLLQRSI